MWKRLKVPLLLGLLAISSGACSDDVRTGDGFDVDEVVCGDGVVGGDEVCDGAELAGQTCEALGFGPGTLSCNATCTDFRLVECAAPASCGNGRIDGTEACDGAELAGATCESLGLGAGELSCSANCAQFDQTDCSASCEPDCAGIACGPDPVCGTDCGACAANESCNGAGMCVCQPTSCAAAGAQCGAVDDGCGGQLDCGGCSGVQTCTNNSCGCDLIVDGGTLSVDVPVVDVTFDLTLGGQPLTAANTSVADEGGLMLFDPVSGDRILLPDAYDAGAIRYPQTIRLVPGVYDIYYYNDGAERFWPVNDDTRLMQGVDLTSSTTISVDVPFVDVIFNLSLNGSQPSLANTNVNDEGGLLLEDTVTGERIVLPDAYDAGMIRYPMTLRVVPGVYDIYYYNDGAELFWPANNNYRLLSAVDLTSPNSVSIDLFTIEMTFGLTLGGQPVTTANTNVDDEGGLALVDPMSGERIVLPDAYDAGVIRYPHTVKLLPDFYDVYYYNDGADLFWPINDNRRLRSLVDFTTSGSFLVDIPLVPVIFELSVGGVTPDTSNTSVDDEGGLVLVDKASDERIVLATAYDAGAIVYPLTRRVIPGLYDVHYYNDGAAAFWPINDDAQLIVDADLTTGTTLAVDVPVVDRTFELTVDGTALSAANTNIDDEGGLVLVDTTTNERIVLPDAYDAGTIRYPMTRRLVPGSYHVHYYNDGAQAFWPINDDKRLLDAVDMTSTGTLSVDVPVIDLIFGLSVDGSPASLANSSVDDEGGLILEDVQTAERIVLPAAYDAGTILYPLSRRLVPGTYDVYYHQDGAQSVWPVNDNRLLTCFAGQ